MVRLKDAAKKMAPSGATFCHTRSGGVCPPASALSAGTCAHR
jgi:hypothetical protein